MGSQATRTIGFAFKTAALILAYICELIDVSVSQLGVRLNADGTVSVVKAPGISSGGFVVRCYIHAISAVYVYMEFSSVINNSTGSYTLKVNGVQWLTVSNVNTQSKRRTTLQIYARKWADSGSN